MAEEITSRSELHDYFDAYTNARKEELNKRSLKVGSGLLKAYLLETSANTQLADVVPTFEDIDWELKQIEDDLYKVQNIGLDDCFIDVLSPRYYALYTTAKSDESDSTIKRAVKESIELDHVWISSPIMNMIWRDLNYGYSKQFATLRYENEPLFEVLESNNLHDEQPDDELGILQSDDDLEEDTKAKQVARLEIKQRIFRLHEIETESSVLGELLGNLNRMRVPATNQRGRYEYYHYGKMTNRGDDFRAFSGMISTLIDNIYGNVTSQIERVISFQTERQILSNGTTRTAFFGAPVVFTFRTPLSEDVFEKFIHLTFERGQGPFRLWGTPIRLSGPKVHIYGADLHLWQQIYLDLTPSRFVLIIPQGTCGNTVHRLVTNIQRYLDPRVTVMIGDISYEDLLRQALRSQ